MSRRDQLNKSMAVLFPQVRETTAEIDGRERTVFVPDNSACRVCTEDVVDGRWNYCSERCREIAQAVQAKFLWAAVREQVLERDDHTCRHCGLSKERWWRAYWQISELIDERTAHLHDEGRLDEWRTRRRELKAKYDIDAPVDGAYHVDHIQPISEGGHPLDESNLQTLCRDCHHAKTADENSTNTGVEARPEIPLEAYLES